MFNFVEVYRIDVSESDSNSESECIAFLGSMQLEPQGQI